MRCFILLLLLPALPFQSCIAWVCPTIQRFATTRVSRKNSPSTILAISQAPYISGAEQSWDDVQAKERHVAADSSTYLIHTGHAIKMIKRCVAIEGLSVSDGWTPQATEAFSLAVEAVVRANPILTGQLIEEKRSPWPWAQTSSLRVIPGVFPPESHSFLTTVKPPANLTSPAQVVNEEMNEAASAKELFHHVHSHIAPCLLGKAEFSYDQIKNVSPLFEAKIMDFGDGYAAYSIKMSHALGDGTTFFQIIKQLSSYMNGHTSQPINWDNPLKATHEIYPETFSKQDYDRSYGGPFGWGVLKNIRTLGKRKCEFLLLNKDKIAKKKRELHESTENARISSNDVVMSVICQMCGSSDIFAFDRSVRGIKDGVDKSDAGNFFWEIPFDREKGAANPSVIRNILTSESGTYYDTDEVPLLPSLSGRVGRITSLASITQKTTFPGSNVICQFPSASFISDLPLDVAVIFRFDEDHFGLMHNFRRVTPSPLLSEIIA
mmetsp:Transcript_17889/g.25350  ORF Transcript_17889/g.25350 Transcript_17889/m.25350 type:complete len:492 (+) Transcript_17889:104-1579(+)